MRLLYTIGVALYGFSIRLGSLFNSKAKLWVKGRKHWSRPLKNARKPGEKWVWFHCASLGEFEQGRPLIEGLKKRKPELKILLTFFSPSGYEIRKDYKDADHVCYLPLDLKGNVSDFLDIVKPSLAIFIKYEIWVNYLFEMKKRKIQVVLVSAQVRKNSSFFRFPFASLYKKAFASFDLITTQSEEAADILKKFSGNANVVHTGDTRFDRVLEIRNNFTSIPEIEKFKGNDFCVVAGSTWPKDDEILLKFIQKTSDLPVRWIIAPHDIHEEWLKQVALHSNGEMITFSDLHNLKPTHKVLWIDNIGMLSRLYHYADIAYIGGGFDKGIHNTLEAVVYGCPVAFGPKYEKFNEAVELVKSGGGVCVRDQKEMEKYFYSFFEDGGKLSVVRGMNRSWVEKGAGASERVLGMVEGMV